MERMQDVVEGKSHPCTLPVRFPSWHHCLLTRSHLAKAMQLSMRQGFDVSTSSATSLLRSSFVISVSVAVVPQGAGEVDPFEMVLPLPMLTTTMTLMRLWKARACCRFHCHSGTVPESKCAPGEQEQVLLF